MGQTVELPYEVVTDIVVAELNDQLTYHLNVIAGRSEWPVDHRDVKESYALVSALIKVLDEFEHGL